MIIHLPQPADIVYEKPPTRLNFAPQTLTEIRPKGLQAPQNVTDMMIYSGLKQVHGLNQNDMNNSRRRLLEMGFIDERNFDNVDESDLNFEASYSKKKSLPAEMKENITMLDQQERIRLTELNKGKAFEAWAAQKEAREQALIYLASASLPELDNVDNSRTKPVNSHRAGGNPTTVPPVAPPSYYRRSENAIEVRDGTPASALRQFGEQGYCTVTEKGIPRYCSRESMNDVLDIGRALKKVDRTLLSSWTKWCESIIPPGVAQILWDYFYPTACDLHGMVGSEVRYSFQ
jgi:hypothetical protein